MSDTLGLSIGTTNLVAVRADGTAVSRRSVLTVFDHRPAEVGLPSENPNLTEHGRVMWGFVERVGDPIPLVAQDGTGYRADALAADALEAMARIAAVGMQRAPSRITVAVPAYWGSAALGALRGALRSRKDLLVNGAPPELISDAAAALAALLDGPGLPSSGVVALCDFGGGGTTIALADASAGLQPIGEIVRYGDLSGEQIDQAILNHVLAGIADVGDADPAGTAAVGSLTRLRTECRAAKERLSAETATVIPVELPGSTSDVRFTRSELDGLLGQPLAGFLDALGDTLERNSIPASRLSAVATVGGGAAVPLLTQRLSEELRVPVVTLSEPGLAAAAGATMLADPAVSPDAETGLAPAADMPTGMSAAAWASGAAGAAASQSASDGSPSATFRALAWSQDDEPSAEPVPYSGADYTVEPDQGGTSARPPVLFEQNTDQYTAEPALLPWYKRPPVLFGAAAAAALLAAGGLAVTLTSSTGSTQPVTQTITLPNGEVTSKVFESPTSATVTYTGTNGQATTSVVPPPPMTTTTTTTSPTTTTTTTTSPTTTTTTTTSPTTTTTTTRTTTTTQPTTTQPTTTQPTTTQPPTTSRPPTTTAPPPTTTAPLPTTVKPPEPEPVTPEPVTPEPVTPEVSLPQPEVTVPPVTVPEAEVPDVVVPDVVVPDVVVPDVVVPAASVPN